LDYFIPLVCVWSKLKIMKSQNLLTLYRPVLLSGNIQFECFYGMLLTLFLHKPELLERYSTSFYSGINWISHPLSLCSRGLLWWHVDRSVKFLKFGISDRVRVPSFSEVCTAVGDCSHSPEPRAHGFTFVRSSDKNKLPIKVIPTRIGRFTRTLHAAYLLDTHGSNVGRVFFYPAMFHGRSQSLIS
jgi:hypothetical protein